MRKIIFLVLLLCTTLTLQAAGPMMHVVLGERWLAIYQPNYTAEQKKQFLLGTVFPDIRYLGVIQKDHTHFKGITLQKVLQATTPFQQGMLFHSFVDDYRNTLVYKTNIHKKCVEVPSKLQSTFLKLIEDQILFSRGHWGEFMNFLSFIPDEEKKYNIEEKSLVEWHTGLSLYFTLSPAMILSQISLLDQRALMLDMPTVKKWSVLLPQYAQKIEMQEHVDLMLKAFDKALQKKQA